MYATSLVNKDNSHVKDGANSEDNEKSVQGEVIESVQTMEVHVGYSSNANLRKTNPMSNQSISEQTGNNLL